MTVKTEIKEIQRVLQDVERVAAVGQNLELIRKVHRIHGEMYAYLQQYDEMTVKLAKLLKEAKAMREYSKAQKH